MRAGGTAEPGVTGRDLLTWETRPTSSANFQLSPPVNNTNYIHQSLLSSFSAPRTLIIISFYPCSNLIKNAQLSSPFTGRETAGSSVTLLSHGAIPKENTGLTSPVPAPAAALASLAHPLPRLSRWASCLSFLVNTKTEFCTAAPSPGTPQTFERPTHHMSKLQIMKL